MTRQKSFKGRVRARMAKTGESYTTARRHLLPTSGPAATRASTADETPSADQPAAPGASPVRAMRLPDDVIEKRTGHGWDHWIALLDSWNATTRTHGEIASWLADEHGVDGWSAQSITVTYEQVKGIRAPGQRPDGTFTISVSKTAPHPVARLFEAFTDPAVRQGWLPDAHIRLRTVIEPRSVRADWPDGSRIVVSLGAKSEAKTQVTVTHEKIADAESAAELKAQWRELLAALVRLLAV